VQIVNQSELKMTFFTAMADFLPHPSSWSPQHKLN